MRLYGLQRFSSNVHQLFVGQRISQKSIDRLLYNRGSELVPGYVWKSSRENISEPEDGCNGGSGPGGVIGHHPWMDDTDFHLWVSAGQIENHLFCLSLKIEIVSVVILKQVQGRSQLTRIIW